MIVSNKESVESKLLLLNDLNHKGDELEAASAALHAKLICIPPAFSSEENPSFGVGIKTFKEMYNAFNEARENFHATCNSILNLIRSDNLLLPLSSEGMFGNLLVVASIFEEFGKETYLWKNELKQVNRYLTGGGIEVSKMTDEDQGIPAPTLKDILSKKEKKGIIISESMKKFFAQVEAKK